MKANVKQGRISLLNEKGARRSEGERGKET